LGRYIDTSQLDVVGGFDEHFAGEEVYFSLELKAGGFKYRANRLSRQRGNCACIPRKIFCPNSSA
jgi:hypothetical protein